MAAAEPAGCVAADAAGTHLARMDNVVRLISLGSESAPMRTSNSSLLSAAALRDIPAIQLIQQLAIESSVHLSIDLGVLAPPCVTSEGPPGLTLREIKELIRALGTLHRIVGIDLVGFDVQSEAAAITSIAACHLALAAMSAAHDRA
jgi:arginase family enzyme